MTDVTRILNNMEDGDPSAAEQLLPLIYDELRRLAAQKMAGESPDHTLQATALVHDAYLRLVEVDQVQHWDAASWRRRTPGRIARTSCSVMRSPLAS